MHALDCTIIIKEELTIDIILKSTGMKITCNDRH